MELKEAIEQDYPLDVINEIDKILLKEEKNEQEDVIRFNKLVALIRSGKYNGAEEFCIDNESVLNTQNFFRLAKFYIQYKKGKYQDSQIGLEKINEDQRTFQENLLLAQNYTKLEEYIKAFQQYQKIKIRPEVQEFELEEEMNINIVNNMIMVLLTLQESDQQKNKNLIEQIKQVSIDIFKNNLKIEMREMYLNCVLLLIVIHKTKIFQIDDILSENQDFVQLGENMIQKIENDIKANNEDNEQDDQKDIDNELNFLDFQGEKFSDYLTLFILRTFFMKTKQQIQWKEEEAKKLESLLLDNKNQIKDHQLRLSLLSYLILINTINEQPEGKLNKLLNKIQDEKKIIKKMKLSTYIEQELIMIEGILLLHMHKTTEAIRIIRSQLKQNFGLKNLQIELTMLIKNKNFKSFEYKLQQLKNKLDQDPNNKQLQCCYYLFQLSFYFNLNNQKKYTQIFNQFLQNFFMPEIEKPSQERFLKPKVFTQFTQNVVFYILKNSKILRELREKIINFVDYISDSKAVANIAEGFLEKKDYEVAQKIYKALVQRHPDNMIFASRLNFICSIVSPEEINEDVLPEFELVEDFNTLSLLENEYLKYINENKIQSNENKNKEEKQTQKNDTQKQQKRKKKTRIIWPKNFNFENPGSRPDPERWIPVIMRKKNLKRAIKQGKFTKTQGITANQNKTVEMFTQQHSTAQQKTTNTNKRKNKKNKKKRKK